MNRRFLLFVIIGLLTPLFGGCDQQPTVASPQSPTAPSAPSAKTPLQPGSKVGDMVLTKATDSSPEMPCIILHPPTEPGVRTETCTATVRSGSLIGAGWTAADPKMVASAWQTVTMEMYVDEQPVDLASFGMLEKAGGNRRFWSVALDKPTSGKHTLRYVFHLPKPLDSGIHQFPAGTYDITWVVNFLVLR